MINRGEESEEEREKMEKMEKMEWGEDEWGEESEVEEEGSKWGEEGQELVKAEEVPDVEQHVVDGPYRCHHCLPAIKAYRVKSQYLRHLAEVHHGREMRELMGGLSEGSVVKPYPCPRCGRTSRDVCSTQRHWSIVCGKCPIQV